MKKIYLVVEIDDQTDEGVATDMIMNKTKECLYVVSCKVDQPKAGLGDVSPDFEPGELLKMTDDMRFKNYIRVLCKTDKIKAIKETREKYGWDLRKSKDFVDDLYR